MELFLVECDEQIVKHSWDDAMHMLQQYIIC